MFDAALLLLDILIWGILIVLPGCALWFGVRACLLCTRAGPPSWLDTPWDMLVSLYASAHRVQVVNADGTSGVVIPGIDSIRGAMLMNHRSFGDFGFDVYQARCSTVSRWSAIAVTGLFGVLGLACGKVIAVSRGPFPRKTTRQELQQMCARHTRYLIYPEGTRRASQPNADEPVKLVPGGLKNIWEAGINATCVVAVNKEHIVDERRFRVSAFCWLGRGATIYRACSPPVVSTEYPNFESFYQAVETAWVQTWRRAYALQDDHCGKTTPATAVGHSSPTKGKGPQAGMPLL